jgi:CelD/BcsL family acetyltransferase involved in cellulose biosynthesis
MTHILRASVDRRSISSILFSTAAWPANDSPLRCRTSVTDWCFENSPVCWRRCLRIVQHRAIPEDGLLLRQWNDLVQQMEQPEVFYTYEWAMAVDRAYGTQMVPLLFLAYEEDSLVGVVALATDSSHETVFLTSTTADYCDFICHPRLREEFLRCVFAELKKLDIGILRLANLPADSATAHLLNRAAREYGYSVFSRPAYSCAKVAIDSPTNRATVKESAQRRTRRYAKTLGKNIPVTVSHSKSSDDIGAELPSFAKAHVARFLATGRISNLAHPERRTFLDELSQSLASSGWVTLSRLLADGQVVAWNYGFQFAGSWFWYQPTFVSSFQQYSPGLWLLSKIVEESCDDPQLDRIDLGLGAEGYKERLATASRQTLHATVTASAFRGWKERVRYHSAAAIRSVPRLEALARTGMSHAASLKTRVVKEGPLAYFSRRVQTVVRDQAEFILLEWAPEEFLLTRHPAPHLAAIQPIDMDLLAVAAMQYFNDPETLAYLLRAAEKLRGNKAQGFALVGSEGVPLHFCWVEDFEKYCMSELNYPMKAPSANCLLITDCWTPVSVRGQGHYREAIARVAGQLHAKQQSPWIFVRAIDRNALRGAEACGFVRMFSLLQKRVLFSTRFVESQFTTVTGPLIEVSSAA